VSTPDEVMAKVIEGADLAFQKVIDSLNVEYKKYCDSNKFPYEKLPWKSRVMSYDELYKKVKEERGEEVDKLIEDLNKELLDDLNVDDREFSLKIVEVNYNMWSDKDPVVVVFFSPPY